ncbi:hypothetical protein VDGL01_04737 [Verticillium dahliae]
MIPPSTKLRNSREHRVRPVMAIRIRKASLMDVVCPGWIGSWRLAVRREKQKLGRRLQASSTFLSAKAQMPRSSPGQLPRIANRTDCPDMCRTANSATLGQTEGGEASFLFLQWRSSTANEATQRIHALIRIRSRRYHFLAVWLAPCSSALNTGPTPPEKRSWVLGSWLWLLGPGAPLRLPKVRRVLALAPALDLPYPIVPAPGPESQNTTSAGTGNEAQGTRHEARRTRATNTRPDVTIVGPFLRPASPLSLFFPFSTALPATLCPHQLFLLGFGHRFFVDTLHICFEAPSIDTATLSIDHRRHVPLRRDDFSNGSFPQRPVSSPYRLPHVTRATALPATPIRAPPPSRSSYVRGSHDHDRHSRFNIHHAYHFPRRLARASPASAQLPSSSR